MITQNIHNLTSLWKTAGSTNGKYADCEDFEYSFIQNSQWPNRLWFKDNPTRQSLEAAEKIIKNQPFNIVIPIWNHNDYSAINGLESRFLRPTFSQTGMALELKNWLITSTAAELIPVKDLRTAKKWSLLFHEAFGYTILPETLMACMDSIHFYLAKYEHEFVGTGMLYISENIAGLHAIGTIPSQRMKGFGNEITKQLLNIATAKNLQYSTLQASSMGKGIYLKLGFKEHFQIINYQWMKD